MYLSTIYSLYNQPTLLHWQRSPFEGASLAANNNKTATAANDTHHTLFHMTIVTAYK